MYNSPNITVRNRTLAFVFELGATTFSMGEGYLMEYGEMHQLRSVHELLSRITPVQTIEASLSTLKFSTSTSAGVHQVRSRRALAVHTISPRTIKARERDERLTWGYHTSASRPGDHYGRKR